GLPRVRVVAFDKTGTLTEGRPRVARVAPAAGVEAAHVLALAAAVEAASEHAIGRAIVAAAKDAGLSSPRATDVQVVPGCGVEGDVVPVEASRGDAVHVRVGSPAWVWSAREDRAAGALASDPGRAVSRSATTDRATRVVVEDGGAVVGAIDLVDRLR